MFGDIQTADNMTSDIMSKAKSLYQAVVQAQKQQRSAPYADALQKIGEKFASASAKMQPVLNQQANKVRSDYVASGGSPIDLDQDLWGADPSKGFQTGQGQFTPGYAGDNLSWGQKLKLAPITGRFEGNPTFDALMSALQNKLQQRQVDISDRNSQRDYAASMGNLAETKRYHDSLIDQNNLQNLNNIWQATGKAPAGIPGVTPGTPLYDKVGERKNNMETAIKLAQEDMRYLEAQTVEERQGIINEYFNLLNSQSGSAQTNAEPGITDEDILNMTKK